MLRGARWLLTLVMVSSACGPADFGDFPPLDDVVRADAGGDAGQASDAGVVDAGSNAGLDAGLRDAGLIITDAGVLVPVSHTREFRGVWVASVVNLDFPSRSGLSADAGRAELARIVDVSVDAGFNALIFQVRPESDALYRSNREPWSRFLTGTQGQDPGYDPLGELITLAHDKGLEVHAWVNPYRGKQNSASTAATGHITRVLSQHAITYGTAVTMDPSALAVRDWVVNEVKDLVQRYDVDGLHFDDYFYPYPVSGQTFADNAQYQAYADGGTLSKSDWRRDNVNALVQRVSSEVAAVKPNVRFGISPFGIYRPGQPPGIVGLDAYEDISCDSLHWLEQGWVDYLAPQLYWPTTMTQQRFDALIRWWASKPTGGRSIFPGLAAYRLGMSGFTLSEFQTEVMLTRAEPNARGQIWFRYASIAGDPGLRNTVTDLYRLPALPPPVASRAMQFVAAPTVAVQGANVTVSHATPTSIRAYSVYLFDSGRYVLERIVPAGASAPVTLRTGTWAIAAVDRADVESLGVVVAIP